MIAFPSSIFNERSGKIIESLPCNERMHYFKKNINNYKRSTFFGFQLARAAPALLEACGKPSTRFPPEGLVELPRVLLSMLSSPDQIFKKNRKFL